MTEVKADAKKFLFDKNDFNIMKSKADQPIYTEEHLMAATALGKTEGIKEAKQQQEQRLIDLLGKFLAQALALAEAEEQREVKMCVDATNMAMRITHKILPQFANQFALPEIERVIVQAIEARRDEMRIAVTVPTIHLEALKARMDALALEKGYAGKIILLADDSLPPTDCRVEWADGGAERSFERLSTQIENELAKAVSGMNTTLEQSKQPTFLHFMQMCGLADCLKQMQQLEICNEVGG